jgi:hypothetical protein
MSKLLWNFGLNRMLDITGQECKIVIENETYTFQGILDQQSELVQDDRGVQWVDHQFRLSVLRDIATRIPRDSKQKMLIGNQIYTIRHILLTGDGELCEIYVTKINAFSNECNTPEECL